MLLLLPLLPLLARAGSAGDDYYEPYRDYGLPTHLLDVKRKARACGLSRSVYFFTFVRDDQQSLLAHFLRWYDAAGIDFTNALVVVHSTTSNATSGTLDLLKSYKANVETIVEYSSKMKAERVNQYMATLPKTAWLVYPDVDEFFLFPCSWGGPVLPVLDHLRNAHLDAAVAGAVLGSFRELAAESKNETPWSYDFVGGEMFDRTAWTLKEVRPPPKRRSGWTNADIGNASIFHQFPFEIRATSCLFHSRPFKHILTRVECHNGGIHRFESSHLTSCFGPATGKKALRGGPPPGVPADLQRTPPVMYPTTYAFPHFRFTRNNLADAKRAAYLKLRGDVNADHAANVYAQTRLFFDDENFRPEVRLVLDLDCTGNRPFAHRGYDRASAGRLDIKKRRVLFRLLAMDPSSNHKAFAHFFTVFFPISPDGVYHDPSSSSGRNLTGIHPDVLRRRDLLIHRGDSPPGTPPPPRRRPPPKKKNGKG